MTTTTVWIATAENAVRSYDITAVGATEAEALRLCKKAVRTERKRLDLGPYEYFDDLQALPLTVGKAYYDEGRAGEVSL